MSRPIHRLFLAFALLGAPMLASAAASPPSPDNGPAIFLGTADEAGTIADCSVTPCPTVELQAPQRLQQLQAVTVQTTQGVKLRAAPTASAEEVGRRAAGRPLTLRGLYVSGVAGAYYVWGIVERQRQAVHRDLTPVDYVPDVPEQMDAPAPQFAIHVRVAPRPRPRN